MSDFELDSQPSGAGLAARYRRIREFSLRLAAPLSAEDCAIQSMPDASPTRWHLAHTTWFFETFVLKHTADFIPFDTSFEYLFNSYYNSVGEQFPRQQRGLLSRPGLSQTSAYRQHVDGQMLKAFEQGTLPQEVWKVVELGLQHEQQHQELILTDIKHALACNPLYPVYMENLSPRNVNYAAERGCFVSFPERLVEIGICATTDSFAFDNESPKHKFFLQSYELATTCVTNGEYLVFMQDGGYERPELWLSLGWQQVQSQHWKSPLYWSQRGREWYEFSLNGLLTLDEHAPVCHVSYFEADAYARWAGCRLPTEFEWEAASAMGGGDCFADLLLENGFALHPHGSQLWPAAEDQPLHQLFGNVWEWTASQYLPYPGFAPSAGALGEYNGKFMCNQFVLRGGSCATSSDHIRRSYRNFFPPEARWQFSGIRLAH